MSLTVILALSVAAAVGLALGAWLGRSARWHWKRDPALRALSEGLELPAGLGDLLAEGGCYRVRDAAQRREVLLDLAEALSPHGAVVLAPHRDSRSACSAQLQGRPGFVWSQLSRPPVEELLLCSWQLRGQGRITLLVEGPGALEQPLAGEDPGVAVQELLLQRPAELGVLLLLLPDELPGLQPELQAGARQG